MSDSSKVTPAHRQRTAIVYVRQSTLLQLERNKESTARQYDLVERAVALGWSRARVGVVDEDQGHSGSSTIGRSGFAELAAQVGLGQVGIVLALEVSRLARNNADWYRLLDLAAMTDTLVADADGVYHPRRFDDRLVLGMKGTMAEAELHILRARLDGGVRNKAARGELRRALPVGLVWGKGAGEIRLHPDEAVTGVIRAVFERFAACGSARSVWLWLREQDLKWPLQPAAYLHGEEIVWVAPTYHAVHNTLTHPAYAGAYVYGRTRFQRRLDADGLVRTHRRVLPRDQWQVLITDHHQGFISWEDYLANQDKIGSNTRPRRHESGTGAVREGCALLQGLATCGTCGRKLAVFYQGPAKSVPNYYCQGPGDLVDGRGTRHMNAGGQAIDSAVAGAFLAALAPAALQACLTAAQQLEDGHDTALQQWRRQGEHADAEAELARRQAARPKGLSGQERAAILALGDDLDAVWDEPTTTDKDRKQLLRTLLEEVNITLRRDAPDPHAGLVLRWKSGTVSSLIAPLRRPQPKIRTAEDTIALIRRLAAHYPDAVIAGILNRQHRTTARGMSFTANRVASLRTQDRKSTRLNSSHV